MLILTFNVHTKRFSASLKRMITLFMRLFNNPKFLHYVVLVFTHCDANYRSKYQNSFGQKRDSYSKLVGDIFTEVFNVSPQSVPCFFLDSPDFFTKNDPQTQAEFNSLSGHLHMRDLPLFCTEIRNPEIEKKKKLNPEPG